MNHPVDTLYLNEWIKTLSDKGINFHIENNACGKVVIHKTKTGFYYSYFDKRNIYYFSTLKNE